MYTDFDYSDTTAFFCGVFETIEDATECIKQWCEKEDLDTTNGFVIYQSKIGEILSRHSHQIVPFNYTTKHEIMREKLL